MMSTDSVELSNFINPDLTWKTVAKGSRSATRRTRKSVSSSAMADAEVVDKISTEVEGGGVSESEKLGVAVLGRHFAGKVEHVPIKKRRFIFRSPSPPPSKKSSSPRQKVPEQSVHINQASDASKLSSSMMDGKTLVSSNKLSAHDFSGIEILADVACKSGMRDDIEPAQNYPLVVKDLKIPQNSSTLSIPMESISLSAGIITVSQKDTMNEGETENGVSQENSVTISNVSSADECNGKAAQGETENFASQDMSVAVSDKSSADECNGVDAEAKTETIASQINSTSVSEKSYCDEPSAKTAEVKTEDMVLVSEIVAVSDKSCADECDLKVEDTTCLRDGRLHWDLNLSMDDWEQPRDFEDDASQRNFKEVSERVEPEFLLDTQVQRHCSDNQSDPVKGVNGDISVPSDLKADTDEQNSKEFQSGYDSQFEDGELRESYPCWEDNDGDAGEIEQVDYDTEPEDERFYPLDESNDKKMVEDVEKGMVSECDSGTGKTESGPSRDALRMRTTETNDGSDIEKHVVCMDDAHAKGSSMGFRSKPYKREFPFRINGALSSDAIPRRRSDVYDDDSYSRDDRDAGSDKFMGRDRSGLRGRSPGGRHFGYVDYRRRRSPIYNNGSYNFGRPRPKSGVESRGGMPGSDTTLSGPDGHIRRQFSNGAYRNRFRRYPDGFNKDFRGIDRSMPGDLSEYPGRLQHRLARRERSNSPVFRRLNYPQPYRKSRSRSRSRSPVAWNNRNRSPNFRMDSRMDRVRLPFQKRFPADHEMGFMSPPRNRCSPQRNSRWFEDRNNLGGDNNNFRGGRKSPVRIFRPSQRFDSGQSIRRVNSENHFRPMMRHRRFPDVSGGGGRGCKYEGGNEDKHGNRYEMIHRVRRYDNADGGDIRRFRYNGEEPFVANDS